MDQFRVYIAGFDVFKPDCQAVYHRIREACEPQGLTALVPLDNDPIAGDNGSPADRARQIRAANITMLRQAHAVVANLAPFRGLEPDAGTVFEVGYAQGLGLPVVGYGAGRASYATRVGAMVECVRDTQGRLAEKANGMAVEDFGLPLNLMLASGMPLERDVQAALRTVAAELRRQSQEVPAEARRSITIPGWQPAMAGLAAEPIRFR